MRVVTSWGPVSVGQKKRSFPAPQRTTQHEGGIDSRKDWLGPFLRKSFRI